MHFSCLCLLFCLLILSSLFYNLQKFLGWVKLGVMEAENNPPIHNFIDAMLELEDVRAELRRTEQEIKTEFSSATPSDVAVFAMNYLNSLRYCQVENAERKAREIKAQIARLAN